MSCWLESQLHPRRRPDRRVASRPPPDAELAVMEVPLLFESGMEGLFDGVLAVTAPASCAPSAPKGGASASSRAATAASCPRARRPHVRTSSSPTTDRSRSSRLSSKLSCPSSNPPGGKRVCPPQHGVERTREAAPPPSAARRLDHGRGPASTRRVRDRSEGADAGSDEGPPAPLPARRRGRRGVGVFAVARLGIFDDPIKEITLPLRHEDIIVQQAADKDVDAALIAGVIYAEYRFVDPTSEAGARGLMQITPGTANEIDSAAAAPPSIRRPTSPTRRSTSSTAPTTCASSSTCTGGTRSPRSPPTTPARARSPIGAEPSSRPTRSASPRRANTSTSCSPSARSTARTTPASSGWTEREPRPRDSPAVLIAWLAFPALLAALALGVGLLAEAVSGRRVPGVLLLPLGLAGLIVAGQASASFDPTAELTIRSRSRSRSPGSRLRCGAAGPCGRAGRRSSRSSSPPRLRRPVIASGDPTFAGYIRLDDTSTWLALTDRVMEHGAASTASRSRATRRRSTSTSPTATRSASSSRSGSAARS